MSEQTLKFDDIIVNKEEFHASKQAIALNSVKTVKILDFLITLSTVMMALNILLAIYMMMM